MNPPIPAPTTLGHENSLPFCVEIVAVSVSVFGGYRRAGNQEHQIEQLMPPVEIKIADKSTGITINGSGGSLCAICLGDFKDGEWCRVFPRCNHEFHVPCIDAWLERNLNCPVCRNPLEVAAVPNIAGDDLV
ncbi:probable E3 ubiquitin-protein ligase ATL44 [Corylus avellana]|uniref:probable E3 ubiquitin-protein ligase ATL44 n=1 Tax=Corylus avellana TaxID=13451 RepID=UPI00286BFF51|nr:probable E3 ubiquitin-protein ligase ATL44 [Corylus avellana]